MDQHLGKGVSFFFFFNAYVENKFIQEYFLLINRVVEINPG